MIATQKRQGCSRATDLFWFSQLVRARQRLSTQTLKGHKHAYLFSIIVTRALVRCLLYYKDTKIHLFIKIITSYQINRNIQRFIMTDQLLEWACLRVDDEHTSIN